MAEVIQCESNKWQGQLNTIESVQNLAIRLTAVTDQSKETRHQSVSAYSEHVMKNLTCPCVDFCRKRLCGWEPRSFLLWASSLVCLYSWCSMYWIGGGAADCGNGSWVRVQRSQEIYDFMKEDMHMAWSTWAEEDVLAHADRKGVHRIDKRSRPNIRSTGPIGLTNTVYVYTNSESSLWSERELWTPFGRQKSKDRGKQISPRKNNYTYSLRKLTLQHSSHPLRLDTSPRPIVESCSALQHVHVASWLAPALVFFFGGAEGFKLFK